MQPILIQNCSYGLPLCVIGIRHPFALSTEILDHELRKEALKKMKQRSEWREDDLVADLEMGNDGIIMGSLDIDKDGGDLVEDLNDFDSSCISHTAKAA